MDTNTDHITPTRASKPKLRELMTDSNDNRPDYLTPPCTWQQGKGTSSKQEGANPLIPEPSSLQPCKLKYSIHFFLGVREGRGETLPRVKGCGGHAPQKS